MKKLVMIVSILFLFVAPVSAIDWTTANEKTVTWEAVTTLVDGSTIPAEDTIEYELFLVPYASTDRESDKVSSGVTALLEFTYTFTAEGRFLAGIRSLRTPKDLPEEKGYSEMVWSDGTDVAEPFGFIYLLRPGKVGTFKPK